MSDNSNSDMVMAAANEQFNSTSSTDHQNDDESKVFNNDETITTSEKLNDINDNNDIQLDGDDNNTANSTAINNAGDSNGNTSGGEGSKNNNSSNRKRKHDNDRDNRNGNNKRSNNSGRGGGDRNRDGREKLAEGEVFFKLLIPSSAAGGVIGRGGEKIAQMQKDANVRMKMSKANDYYPNTNERVCLIVGPIDSVLKAYELVMDRVHEKPDNARSNDSDEKSNTIRILIPNTTAGLLIGKGGAYIKQIKDESGAFVQISSKQTDLPERIITIEGEGEKRKKALSMVVNKIAEDPQHNSVPSMNYSAMQSSSHSGGSGDHYGSSSGGNLGTANQITGLSNLALLIINCGGSFQMTADSLKVSLRNAGYSSSAMIEIIDAITVLMSYGLISKVPSTGGLGNNSGSLFGSGGGGMHGGNHGGYNHGSSRSRQSYKK